METIGQKLNALREQQGVSLRKVASVGGWANASSVQKYFEPVYNHSLRKRVADQFAASLGPGVYDIAGIDGEATPVPSLQEVLSILRSGNIPADIRCAAAAEKVSQMLAPRA